MDGTIRCLESFVKGMWEGMALLRRQELMSVDLRSTKEGESYELV
jgi:hypothetical protein